MFGKLIDAYYKDMDFAGSKVDPRAHPLRQHHGMIISCHAGHR
jgi:hypothetical protein